MNISYNWLRNYIDCDVTAEEIAVILTDIGLEVEGFEKIELIKGGLEGVVVGEVITCEKHPESDHLSLTTVDVGAEEPLQIICGAQNCRKGIKVLCATIGTTLFPIGSTESFKIKKSKIRGIESFGMLCAEDELGLGVGHDGIMELPNDAIIGTSAKNYLDIKDDYLLEIGLTPNRIDAASHYGVARDLAAYLKANGQRAELKLPNVDKFSVDNHSRRTDIVVENRDAAPRYVGINISNVKIAPSPEWLQRILGTIGINPKNNVVDITNYVLHELCQPLHSFDADKINGDIVVVRTCADGTKFKTLDGVERTLSGDDLMICDGVKPMCIAGVFGGESSGVHEGTKNIFLESAYFNPVSVRKTAKRHGLNTDASFRFERGIDPDITVFALKRAAMLIKELAGGEITSDIFDIYSNPIKPFRFDITYKYINSLIGKEIGNEKIKEILTALEIEIAQESEDTLSVIVSPYRVDVQRPADLVEEVLRIYGYNNIEIPEHVNSTLSYAQKPNKDKIRNLVSDMLTSVGYTEIMNNSLTKSTYYQDLSSYKKENCVKIINPLSNDLDVMRQTLLFGVMESVELNVNHRNSDLKLYEFGNCYQFNPDCKEENKLAPYSEKNCLAIALTGSATAASWNVKGEATNFFHLKAIAEKLLRRFGLNIYELLSESIDSDLFAEGLSVSLNGKELLQMGIVSSKIRRIFDLKSDVYYLEMNFDRLIKSSKKHKIVVSELAKFPEVRRDLALLVDNSISFSTLRDIAFATERKFLKRVSLFDVYMGDKLPEGKKSYALNFVLQDESKTMNDQNIDRIMSNLIKAFCDKANATIR